MIEKARIIGGIVIVVVVIIADILWIKESKYNESEYELHCNLAITSVIGIIFFMLYNAILTFLY